MTSSFHLPVTLLGEEDAGQEGERTSATLLSQDCNHIFISLPFWPRYGQRESVCLRWLLAVRLSTQEGDLGSLGSLRVQYRPGGKFEEVEKAMFIWWTLFFFSLFPSVLGWCAQCLPEVTDSEWLQGSLCFLARVRRLSYLHHQSFTGTSVKKKKKAFFLGCKFSWISLFKILCPGR